MITGLFLFSLRAFAAEAGIPAVFINTVKHNGAEMTKDMGWQDTGILVMDAEGTVIKSDEAGKIKIRGNSTAAGEKKPYNIKFSEKTDLFGFGKASTYCLLANCFDPTLIRNTLALDLADETGLSYTPEHKFVELTVDGVYQGCYLLTEKVETGSQRIDLDIDNGDFLIETEQDRVEAGVTYITPGGEFRFSLSDPEEPTEEQESVISAVLEEIYRTVKEGSFEQIAKVIDIDSFVKFYVFNEYLKNVDFAYSSTYYYYKDGKLYAGPVWDYDLSQGNAGQMYGNYFSGDGSTGYENLWCVKSWYKYLMADSQFVSLVKKELRNDGERFRKLYREGGAVDQMISSFGSLFKKNYSPLEEGGAGWEEGKCYSELEAVPFASFEENVVFLKNWLLNRDKDIQKEIGTFSAEAQKTMLKALGRPLFSASWFIDTDGSWKIRNSAGEIVRNAWLCDDAIPENGTSIWYLLDEEGRMVEGGLVRENEDTWYSLETEHNGHYGMLRYQNGEYDGVPISFSGEHDGTFGKILNQEAVTALLEKFGEGTFRGTETVVYTSSF